MPRKFIIGSDWWTDCDDCMALRVAAHFHKRGIIEILGISIDACMEYSARSLDAFLAHENLPDIEVGIDFEAADYGGECLYQEGLAKKFKSKYKGNESCIDALSLYRKHLALSEEKVHIVELGFLQVLAALIDSEPDGFSPLSGKELIKEKVGRLWVMGGKFDEAGGREHNFAKTPKAAAASHKVCGDWPTPVTFLGFEVSENIICGANLPLSDALGQAMSDHGSAGGRSSWDPMLMLLACIGDENEAGYDTVTGFVSTDPETGKNYFTEDIDGTHRYVVKKYDDGYYKTAVNDILFEKYKF